jgi:hypothetical protein
MRFQYFESLIFKPKELEESMLIEWPEDLEEIFFASPTCFISPETINKELIRMGLISKSK